MLDASGRASVQGSGSPSVGVGVGARRDETKCHKVSVRSMRVMIQEGKLTLQSSDQVCRDSSSLVRKSKGRDFPGPTRM